jgi:transcriptional regulator with XRE-family HTH domain
MMQGSLAERLRVLRAQDGLTLNEASAKIGINRHTLRDLELGKREPYGPTIRKIAEGYGVPVAQLLEEPPLAGKVGAPQEPGQPDTAPQAEEEPTIIPQSAGVLKASVDLIKRTKRHHESQLEEIRQDQLDYHAVVLMELINKGLRTALNEHGVLDFAEAVRAHRELAEPEAIPLCHELLRELRNLEELTDEARATAAMRSSDIHEEVEKDAWQWLSGAGPLVSENAVSSDRAG